MRFVVDKAKEDDIGLIVGLIDEWLSEMNWSWTADRSRTIKKVLKDKNHEVLVAKLMGGL